MRREKRKPSRPNQLRRRIKTNRFNFGRLEPRQLLTADLIGPQYIQIDAGLAPERNLIVNAGFEDATNGSEGMFASADVTGWDTGSTGNLINLLDHPNLDHGNVLDLDSVAATVDGVGQDVETAGGQEYVLTFEFRERPVDDGAAADTNEFEVTWDGEVVGRFTGIAHWQTASMSVTGASLESTTRVEFREVSSDGGDGRGALIDNVRLVAVADMGIENGSFETTSGEGPRFNRDDVAGWDVFGPPEARVLEIVAEESSDGSNHLKLNSSSTNIDRLFRDITTESGATYFVTFDLRGDSANSSEQNELRVRWNNDWAGTFEASDDWRSFGILVDADSDNTRLVFREPGSFAGDGNGPMIDNVRILSLSSVSGDLIADLNGPADGRDFTVAYFEDSGSTEILSTQLDFENLNGDEFTGAEIQIEDLLDGAAAESLDIETGNSNIAASYDAATGTLTLAGRDSVINYEGAFRRLRYNNTSQNPDETDRRIRVTLMDGDVVSEPSFINLQVNARNDDPVLEDISDTSAGVDEPFQAQMFVTDADDDEQTYTLEFSGTAIAEGDLGPVVNDEGIITWRPSRPGFAEITATTTDTSGASDSTTFFVTAEFRANVPSDFEPFSGERQLSNVRPSSRNGIYDEAPEMTIDDTKTYEAVIEMASGEMRFLLHPEEAPLAVNNFVNLANDGYYDGLSFHRVIEGFVAQGGDPAGDGTGGPGYTFADEFDASLRFEGAGVLAMANSGANTNGSQFFVTYASQSHLNDVHTIFGTLTSGQDVLDGITRTAGAQFNDIMYSVTIIET